MIQFKSHLICLSFSLASCLLAIQSVHAESLSDEWNYTNDSPTDSIRLEDGNKEHTVGGTIYEIYGTGIKEDADHIWVGINSNLPLTGLETGSSITGVDGKEYEISNSNIGYGDLFFDFSGLGSFKEASDSASLFAIRFAGNNDSNVPEVGVYNSVKAKSVVPQNAGWSNLYNHNSKVVLETDNSASMGELQWDNDYYDPYTKEGEWKRPDSLIPNVIDSGNKIGDITLLDQDELINAGFDSNNLFASGNELFGFKFDRSLVPDGDFIATLIHECNNDAMATEGLFTPPLPPQPVPEAGTNLGIIVLGLFGLGWQLKHKKSNSFHN
jgi:hypothetical protein